MTKQSEAVNVEAEVRRYIAALMPAGGGAKPQRVLVSKKAREALRKVRGEKADALLFVDGVRVDAA